MYLGLGGELHPLEFLGTKITVWVLDQRVKMHRDEIVSYLG